MQATTEMFYYDKQDNSLSCDMSTIQCNNCFEKNGNLKIRSEKTDTLLEFKCSEKIMDQGEIVAFEFKSNIIATKVILFND